MLAVEQGVVLETDPATARELARKHMAVYLALPNYVNNLLRHGFAEDDVADGGSDRLVDAIVAWGDEDAIAERVAEHHEAGADHVCLQVVGASRASCRARTGDGSQPAASDRPTVLVRGGAALQSMAEWDHVVRRRHHRQRRRRARRRARRARARPRAGRPRARATGRRLDVLAGGGMWVPANRFMLADGDQDSSRTRSTYMETLIGDLPPASSRERKEAFVDNAPRMLEFFESQGLEFRRTTGYPDYFPHLPAGARPAAASSRSSGTRASSASGRTSCRSAASRATCRSGRSTSPRILLAKRTFKGFRRLGEDLRAPLPRAGCAGRSSSAAAARSPASCCTRCLRRDIPVWLETRVAELVVEDGRVAGVVAERDGKQIRIQARKRRLPRGRRLRPQRGAAREVRPAPDHELPGRRRSRRTSATGSTSASPPAPRRS